MAKLYPLEVSLHVTRYWLARIPMLLNVEPGFIREFARSFESAVFAPRERVRVGGKKGAGRMEKGDTHAVMYFLEKGLATRAGKLLGASATWGEDFVIKHSWLIHNEEAVALISI